ncbi:MAG: molybdate ABC transporter permease subunit [Polyangiaceae bacterium]|nr:molybdate ABC transporter permease subunit [Polyangiaceae bacterium]
MYTSPLLLSFQVAIVATTFAALFGILIGLLLSKPFFGRDLADVIVTAPIVLPPTVLGYYVLVLLGRQSPIGHAFEALTGSPIVFTRTGATIAAFIGALPLTTKSARAALESVDYRLVLAARTLGAGPVRAFVTVHLPLAARGILAGTMLGFARSLGDFGVTLMVAGDIPGQTQTASLAIYDALQAGRDGDAAFLVGFLTLLSGGLLYAITKLTGRADAR